MDRDRTSLDYAQELDAFGLNVLPARRGHKAPLVAWQKFQTQRTTSRLSAWFAGNKATNYWINTGSISGVVVLDVDSPEADEWWRQHAAEWMDATAAVRTAHGTHYYGALSDDDATLPSWGRHLETGVSFDVRAEGAGVIVPPSVHESGVEYAWIRDLTHLLPAPRALRGVARPIDEPGASPARSMLAELLANPPQGEGGRNNWLARVAGHYAKHFRSMRDAYEIQCAQAAGLLVPSLAPSEVQKTIESIWRAEQAHLEASLPDEANGWLMAGDRCLFTQIRIKDGREWRFDRAEWADFDLRAVGVVEDEDASRTYDVEIWRKRQGDVRRGLLPAGVLSRVDRLIPWLAEYGVTVAPPDAVWPAQGSVCARLQRYLESQKPQHFRVVEHLGRHGDGFVCHEGVINADGLSGFQDHKPDPKLRNWAPYHYGFGAEDEARSALRAVLTFHDETVCSVFGAWWAACFLKPQIHEVTSQFPFMALEAPSESGKTTGFFSLMLQLNGNAVGQVDLTRAALRDWLSANQSGIVWIDDLSGVDHLMDLMRQATGEGSVGKKGEDRHAQEMVKLVAPICMSGESLQLHGQKALLDRAILLEVPSPTQRRSLVDPERLQWTDVVALRKRHPDLTVFAGNAVQWAWQLQDLVGQIPDLVPEPGGRWGDKIAVMRAGARVLSAMTEDDTHTQRVDEWALAQVSVGSENALTMKLLPAALEGTGWLSAPLLPEGRWPATPTFVQEGMVWFSIRALTAWWAEMQRGRIQPRTESGEALEQQARALGLGGEGRKRFNLSGDRKRKAWYWGLPQDLSKLVLARSRGGLLPGPTGMVPGISRLALLATVDQNTCSELAIDVIE